MLESRIYAEITNMAAALAAGSAALCIHDDDNRNHPGYGPMTQGSIFVVLQVVR